VRACAHLDVWSKRQETLIKAVLLQEGKKKFEKQTAKFCLSQERYLNLSTKKQDAVLKEVSTDRHIPSHGDSSTKRGTCS
jgi:hypothetical protein